MMKSRSDVASWRGVQCTVVIEDGSCQWAGAGHWEPEDCAFEEWGDPAAARFFWVSFHLDKEGKLLFSDAEELPSPDAEWTEEEETTGSKDDQ